MGGTCVIDAKFLQGGMWDVSEGGRSAMDEMWGGGDRNRIEPTMGRSVVGDAKWNLGK